MKLQKSIITLLVLCFTLGTYAQKDMKEKKDLKERAMEVKQQMLEKDPSLSALFNSSTGYVIFPAVGEAGFIIGGASGNGVVYENNMFIGTADLKQIDVGLQAGGKTYGEVIFFKNQDALDTFKNNKFELSAELSATLINEGAAKKTKFKNDVLVFVLPKKGLMADASVGAQRFTFEKNTDTRVSDF
ncbi:lipid-binding SYLF domain-containing protein [Aquimarina sp. U1-2]|uniref:lipid-binding SYLF domain-containing protein n=1 Tax=Aquimarina sp. U1-2 TaxID=2823141 RepID=UPI001AECC24F|nr:lipid-binding SYLF domain-containing protein [Aquimarina sp. U1-2]MBP2830836.1 lipid-binding SYLF domain-containing protein [Aquimarina sp. U1-2]